MKNKEKKKKLFQVGIEEGIRLFPIKKEIRLAGTQDSLAAHCQLFQPRAQHHRAVASEMQKLWEGLTTATRANTALQKLRFSCCLFAWFLFKCFFFVFPLEKE